MNRLIWLIVFFTCFLFAEVTRSQEVTYTPFEKFDIRSGDFSVIGKIGNRIYTYRGSNEGFFLDAYNDSMEKTATIMLDFFPRKIYETRFINYPNQIIVLYQAVESGKVIQYAALLDHAGRLLKGPLQLTSARMGVFGPNRDYFSSAVSDEKKQVLVYGIEAKNDELKFNGIWLDDQLNILQRSNASFKADNDVAHGEGILDNNGNLFLPAFTPTGVRNYADRLWLLTLSKGERRFFAKELPLNGLYATTTHMKLDNTNNRLYTGGLYSDKKNGNYEGVIFAYYDLSDSTWQNRKYIAFDATLRDAAGDRNKNKAFNDYHVKQIIIRKDGGFVLISEEFYVSNRTAAPGWGGYYSFYYGPFMSQSLREYNYNDILTLSYNAEGVKEWHSFIRKSQYSQEDGGVFSSYALINTGGTLGFLFNDFNTKNSRIQLATIDAAGKLEMHSLMAASSDPDWLPRSARQTGLKELIIPCLRKRQVGFAKIVF